MSSITVFKCFGFYTYWIEKKSSFDAMFVLLLIRTISIHSTPSEEAKDPCLENESYILQVESMEI